MRAHNVPLSADGMPLGKYIRRAYPMADSAMLRRALRQRDFKQSGARLGEADPVRGGAELCCFMSDAYLLGEPLKVLYNEGGLAAIVKPAGLTCQRDALGIGEDTLESRVKAMFGEAYLVNRLDHFTGGVMPIALDVPTRDALMAAFAGHGVNKTYVCQVAGRSPEAQARLKNYAVKSADESLMRVYDSPRDGAVTMILRYEVIKSDWVSRLRVHLETGRTHQIRAQLSHAGLPVLGDDKYGDRAANKKYNAAYQRLWCESIELCGSDLPESYRGLKFTCEAPF